jgi:hypothetical protein
VKGGCFVARTGTRVKGDRGSSSGSSSNFTFCAPMEAASTRRVTAASLMVVVCIASTKLELDQWK